jgi:hypothetical protein
MKLSSPVMLDQTERLRTGRVIKDNSLVLFSGGNQYIPKEKQISGLFRFKDRKEAFDRRRSGFSGGMDHNKVF